MLEFKVIVLAAGRGSRFLELTDRKPKCLLPIGNHPMVYYPLKLIENSGFKEVFLIILENAESEVQSALENTDLSININFVTIPCNVDWGTADSLRYTLSRFTDNVEQCDFIVVSCDLLSTVNIKSVLNFHRKNDASFTALYFQSLKDCATFTVPGTKMKSKQELDVVVIDPRTSRLVFVASASDFEDELPLKRALLYKHGHVRIYTKLLDAHFFILKKWLITYLTYDKNLSTVKGELLPFALKMQMSCENKLPSNSDSSIDVTPVKSQADKKNSDFFCLAKNVENNMAARCMSSFNDHSGDLNAVYLNDSVRCYGLIVENEFGIRTNNLHEFYRANKLILQYWERLVDSHVNRISPESVIESNQLDKETCFIGPLTCISPKTSVSFSTFGRGCTVEPKTKIVNCIVMNNVRIKEGCSLSNCIICDDVIIETNCVLKDCLIGGQYIVSSHSSYTNEILAEIVNLMEV